MKISNKQELIDIAGQGARVKYIFFWGHKKPVSGLSASCFSQWYESPFERDGIRFATAEHYMMYHKACLFGDQSAADKVVSARTPGEAKAVGRGVAGFNESIWCKHRFEIVVAANVAKFSSRSDFTDYLLSTGNRVLVEASPVDVIWGAGLAADDHDAANPARWPGMNLLGFAIMEARDRLAAVSSQSLSGQIKR